MKNALQQILPKILKKIDTHPISNIDCFRWRWMQNYLHSTKVAELLFCQEESIHNQDRSFPIVSSCLEAQSVIVDDAQSLVSIRLLQKIFNNTSMYLPSYLTINCFIYRILILQNSIGLMILPVLSFAMILIQQTPLLIHTFLLSCNYKRRQLFVVRKKAAWFGIGQRRE